MTSCTVVLQNTLNFSLAPLVLAIEAPLEKNLRAPMKVGLYILDETQTHALYVYLPNRVCYQPQLCYDCPVCVYP